jgi:hypothetical protein
MPPPRPFTSHDIVHCSLYYYFFLTNTKMAKKNLTASFIYIMICVLLREVIDTSRYVCMVKRTRRAKMFIFARKLIKVKWSLNEERAFMDDVRCNFFLPLGSALLLLLLFHEPLRVLNLKNSFCINFFFFWLIFLADKTGFLFHERFIARCFFMYFCVRGFWT